MQAGVGRQQGEVRMHAVGAVAVLLLGRQMGGMNTQVAAATTGAGCTIVAVSTASLAMKVLRIWADFACKMRRHAVTSHGIGKR